MSITQIQQGKRIVQVNLSMSVKSKVWPFKKQVMLLLTQILQILQSPVSLVMAGARYLHYNRIYLFCQIWHETAIKKITPLNKGRPYLPSSIVKSIFAILVLNSTHEESSSVMICPHTGLYLWKIFVPFFYSRPLLHFISCRNNRPPPDCPLKSASILHNSQLGLMSSVFSFPLFPLLPFLSSS